MTNRITFLITIAVSIIFNSALTAAAGAPEVIPLWEPAPAGTPPDNIPTLTVYRPDTPNGTAVIACPGGGYGHLALTHEGHDLAGWFNGQGITYAVLKYRLPHAEPENLPLADAEQAMRIMRGHSEQWHIDPRRVGIMGSSAGGHLAATLSTICSDESVRPDFQILFYPVISMDEEITNDGTRNNLIGLNPSTELIDKYSLDKQVDKRTPQAFILLSADDGVSPMNSIRYFVALQRHGIPTALPIYPDGGHGWGFRDSFKYKPQWTAEMEKWLSDNINR